MATSSITKTYVVVDEKGYEKLLRDIADSKNRPARKVVHSENLERGNELLKNFSFRSK